MKALFVPLFASVFMFISQYSSLAQSSNSSARTDIMLEKLLNQYPEYFSRIMQNPDSFKVQIIYTQINRDAHNNPSFTNYYYHVDSNKYFYPASTVKLPVALLALQKINEL